MHHVPNDSSMSSLVSYRVPGSVGPSLVSYLSGDMGTCTPVWLSGQRSCPTRDYVDRGMYKCGQHTLHPTYAHVCFEFPCLCMHRRDSPHGRVYLCVVVDTVCLCRNVENSRSELFLACTRSRHVFVCDTCRTCGSMYVFGRHLIMVTCL